ncbi:unnamed protein product [Moneuplotes crassus]|uniref:Uncharacterized protein n=1 Tax=Euplotes crassus TaxID=5936 RepID=A0AAD1Y8D6_EUPCR|nr:unnamed protein product [Moneuplotes crassus]
MPSKLYYVRGGPHLWISSLLHKRGALTTAKIWEEFQRDKTTNPDDIQSKTYLKAKILSQMEAEGKIARARAPDLPQYKYGGWKVRPSRAFKNTAPDVLAQLRPLPNVRRRDYLEYLQENGIEFPKKDHRIE